VDLSDKDKWGTQIKELEKLPKFLQVSVGKLDFYLKLKFQCLASVLKDRNYRYLSSLKWKLQTILLIFFLWK